MTLTESEKLERKRDRFIEKAKELQPGTYARKKVASIFQQMIRAEAAAVAHPRAIAVVDGKAQSVCREVGQCVCVTCGKVGWWKGDSVGGGTIESGHFVPSRRMSILFEETNIHPQCKHCNKYLGGNQGCYEMWMRFVFGQDEIDRLRRLKNENVQFTRGELVDMRIAYQSRLKKAIEIIEGGL